MAKRPIAYLTSEYPAISHTFIFREIQALREQGIDVVTASIRRTENLQRMTPAEKAEAAATFHIKDTPLTRILWALAVLKLGSPLVYLRMLSKTLELVRRGALSIWKAIAYLVEAGLLRHWMRHEASRHVHVHFGNPAATVALIAAADRTISFSMSIHGPDIFDNVEPNLLAEKTREAAFVRCISHFCQSQLMRLVPFDQWPKFHIVRCGVDLRAYHCRKDPMNATPEILCLGRLVAAKGQHVLLQSCRLLRDRGVDYHLTYVGDGPDRPSLEAHSRQLGLDDVVTFAGAVGQDAVHTYYDRADLFVLASFAEGLPVVLMEAMAKGIPCISTRIAGIPEMITDGENGFLLPASDMEGLADRIEQLLTNPGLRTAFGRKGREEIEARYDVERNCRQMADLFREHIENRQDMENG